MINSEPRAVRPGHAECPAACASRLTKSTTHSRPVESRYNVTLPGRLAPLRYSSALRSTAMPVPRFSLILFVVWLPLVVGCEGCRRATDPDAEDKNDEVPLEDFSAKLPSAFPADLNPITGGIKPGHWLTASQPLKSNKIDARGELLSEAMISGKNLQSGDSWSEKGRIETLRPVVLPKGQLRRFDYRMLAPIPRSLDEKKSFLSSRFVSSGRAIFYDTGQQPFNVLAGKEFFFVVLTTRPERFAKFQVATWVEPPRDRYRFQNQEANYQIVIPPVDDVLPISETVLDWTATSVLFWDDLSADALTPTQQVAIADWIRFGGQLIVNGATASDAIADTPLANVLPLKPTGNIELDPGAATELLRGHSVPDDPSTEKQISLVNELSARLAVDGVAAGDATDISDTGKLVLERTVGRGRVVQSRFDLTSDWLSNWESYDSFVNGAILRRPRRRYVKPDPDSALQQTYPDQQFRPDDPTLNTQFRIAARDAILPIEGITELEKSLQPPERNAPTTAPATAPATAPTTALATRSALASRNDGLTRITSQSGVSGWTDNSDAISICRQILRDESGIEIPESSLVVRALGYYLLILVPINYLIFRIIGRLEYAWLAVPLIAIGGAIWVARAARLDIGFARSQTQLAMLELQPDYARGHLSRVVAIYNSLSSSYDIEFNTTDAVAVPIANSADAVETAVFKTGFAEGPILAGLAVGSNQSRMLHAEQIIDVGGPIKLTDAGQLINGTSYTLLDAYVIEKSDTGVIQVSFIGQCNSGSTTRLDREHNETVSIGNDLPMQTGQFIRRLASPPAIASGTSRLVARIENPMPGMTITPEASQAVTHTVVLAHLKHRPLPAAEVDENLISQFANVLTDEDEQEADVLQ